MKEDNTKKETQQKVDELIKIIRWLDDYRVFRVADPVSIEKAILTFCPPELQTSWKRVKKDINAMNKALVESPLRRLIAFATVLRSVATTSIIGFMVLFLAVALFRVSLSLSYTFVFILVIFCLVVLPNFYLYLDRYVRYKIREYHKNLESVFALRMEKVKDFAQQTIYYMNQLIGKYGLDPEKNKFRLRHYDYEGLILVKKRRFSGLYIVKPQLIKMSD
ncbi:MAG: hypothetical protein ACUVUF_07530 [Candidatus Bathycorpusculaceae bacterium]